jgi:ABC-type branched-subunit amino acid transport system substrate-binding protein/streptogramin lyase
MSVVDSRIGTELAGYRVEALVGRGGMGVVYRAHDLALDRPVALKILAPELATDVSFRERFLRESRLAASIDHPNVIPVYDAGEVAGELYIAMRFVEGIDLRGLLCEGPLEPAMALAIVAQVADALDVAHERGLVHRDVKPSNVLIDQRGHVYLADFGLTRRLGEVAVAVDPARSLGTADYVSPEQIRGDDVDARADLYSLGCLLYECLAGRPPYRRDSEIATLFAHLEEEPPELAGLERVFRTALAKDPDSRYQSGRELVEAARSALGLEPKRTRWPLAVAAVGVGLLGAALLAFFLTSSGGGTKAEPGADALVRIDPKTNTVTNSMPVGRLASGVAADSRYVWVTNAGDGTVWRIDSKTGGVLSLSTHGTPTGIAVGGGRAVIVDNSRGSVSSFDADTGALRFSTALNAEYGGPEVAAGSGGIWFGAPNNGFVAKVDDVLASGTASELVGIPTRASTVDSAGSPYEDFDGIAVGEGAVWVAGDPFDRTVWRIDPAAGVLAAAIRLPFIPGAIAAGEGAVWVTSVLGDTVSRIDPRSNRIVATIKVGRGPGAIAVGDGSVWVTSEIDDALLRIDPNTNRMTETIALPGTPTGLAVGAGGVWVTLAKPAARPAPPKAIKIGVYADCTNAFGDGYKSSIAAAELPLIEAGGRLAGPAVTDGVTGASIGGRPVRMLFRCDAAGNSHTARILMQARLLVEKDKVDVLVGPSSGQDERMLEEYARLHPGTTFVDGSGADPIANPAPNYFTLIGDSAQQAAGIGDYAYRRLHWRKAIVFTDQNLGAYGWGQTAAFIGEFCSLGGKIAKRLWIPSGTSDLSGIVSSIPRSGFDGAFLSVATEVTGFNRLLALAVAGPRGDLSRMVLMGTAGSETNLYRLGRRADGLVTSGPALALGAGGASSRGAYRRYVAAFRTAFPKIPSSQVGGIFDVPYADATAAILAALERVHGDLSNGERRFMQALGRLKLDLPSGQTTFDSRHRAIAPNYLWQLRLRGRKLHPTLIRTIPAVDASFGGYFKPTDPPPNRSTPPCVKRKPPRWAH